MPRKYYRHKRSDGSRIAVSPVDSSLRSEADGLLDAAIAASEARNQLNYAWVADFAYSDKNPGDATRRKIAHFQRLIRLVGDADTAWRAYYASKGLEYGTPFAPVPPDVGWLPRYTESLERLRASLAAELLLGNNDPVRLDFVDSDVFSILQECAK